MSEATTQSLERRLACANIIFASLGLGLVAFFLGHGVGLGFFDILRNIVWLFAFFPINILFSIYRRGIICQVILLLSTLLFPILATYDFINAYYINPDPQSGLVFLIGIAYSILMIPFWFVALCLSSQRTVPILKLWYGSSVEPMEDQWLRPDNESMEPKTDVKSNGKDT